ncbi:cytokine receptor family member b2 isoform X2 [Gadus macrocephalus]|uniref:cytokine receptor family member b2 isoform X2 n=1 Tax=Gadus macrocephalus TaxID=80720 RepID=UPI0028CB57A2|nr:cytokine receptor family member b2 isoform X2 [Gadus macrocephalus]
MAVGPGFILLMLAWLSQVFSEIVPLPKPVNVNVTSSHFIHLLTWQRGPGTPRGVAYNVSVSCERDLPWVPVAGCVLVKHPLVCDLTGAFTNPTHVYYSMVVAILESQASPEAYSTGFKPIKDGELASPLLTLAACDHSLCVDLHPPLERVRALYQGLQYQLRVTTHSPGSQPAESLERTLSLKRHVLKDQAPGREYCVSVRIRDPQTHREFPFSPPTCASTPTAGVRSADVLLVVSFLALVLLVVVLYLLVQTGVVCLKKPLPSVLQAEACRNPQSHSQQAGAGTAITRTGIASQFTSYRPPLSLTPAPAWVQRLLYTALTVISFASTSCECSCVWRWRDESLPNLMFCSVFNESNYFTVIFINPLVEERLAMPQKERVCAHIHLGAAAPSAGGKCVARVDHSGEEEGVSTAGSARSLGGYGPHVDSSCSSFSSCSSSSSLSTRPLLAPSLHTVAPLAAIGTPWRHSELQSELRAIALKTLGSVAVTTWDQHALHLACSADPPAPSPEAEPGVGSGEGCSDVNLLSLTLGGHLEDAATLPPTAEEEEVSMETLISVEDEDVDVEEQDGYLRR